MKKLLAISLASASIAIGAIPVLAGLPGFESISEGKWQRVNDNWLIDTEEVDVKGDQIRFWVERNASGIEVARTQSRTSYSGKLRVRCGDFRSRIDPQVRSSYGAYYPAGNWEKIRPSYVAYITASNFCYLTGSLGYTPEPVEHEWQRKLTAEIKNQLSPKAIKKKKNEECTRLMRQREMC